MSAPFLYQNLSYVALGTPKLEESISFYRDLMGLELTRYEPASHAAFRCSDDAANFLLFNSAGVGLLRVGFRLPGTDDLERARTHFHHRGYTVRPLNTEHQLLFSVGEGFSVLEPRTGITFDYFATVGSCAEPFEPRLTKIQRLGHVVIRAENLDEVWGILERDFSFVASDYVENKAVWMRCFPNPLHHSFAVVKAEHAGLHHVNFMVSEIDDIGRARNRLEQAGVDIVFGPGRHKPSGSVFLYFNDPSGMTMEFSYGMEEFPAEGPREPRSLENSAQVMDQWGGFPKPGFAVNGQIISDPSS